MFRRISGMYQFYRVPGSLGMQIFICFLMACLVGMLISVGFAILAVGRFSPTPAISDIKKVQPTPTPAPRPLTPPTETMSTTMPLKLKFKLTLNYFVIANPWLTTTTPFNSRPTNRGERKCPENKYVASDGNVFLFERDAMDYLKKTRIPFKGYRYGPKNGIPCARIYMFDVYVDTFEY